MNLRTYVAIYKSAFAEFTAAQKVASDAIRTVVSTVINTDDSLTRRESAYVAYDAVKEEYEAAKKSHKAGYDVVLAAVKTKYEDELAASKKKYDGDIAAIDDVMECL